MASKRPKVDFSPEAILREIREENGLALLHLFKYIYFNYSTTLLRFSFVTFIQIYSFQLRHYGLALSHLFKYMHFN